MAENVFLKAKELLVCSFKVELWISEPIDALISDQMDPR